MCIECGGSGKTRDTRRLDGLFSRIINITGICRHCETGRKLSESIAQQCAAEKLKHREADAWASAQMELSHEGHEDENQ